ncbi:MAG: HK97 family phage prohead protease [Eubacterium sp.]|nr:HK97 family phage prohead protease [Eubacterium sp.]
MTGYTGILKRETPKENHLKRERIVDAIRTVEGEGNERKFILSFSSEQPYERYWGVEILDHSEGCADLERINKIGCVLFNHKRDAVVGKVLRAWIENGRGMAEIEFDTDEESERIYQKVKSGTLKGVSVGYCVSVWEEVAVNKQSSDGRFTGPAEIAKRWEILEISIVSVPADPTVGVGRAAENTGQPAEIYRRQSIVNKNKARGGIREEMNKKKQRDQKILQQQSILDKAKAEQRELGAEEKQLFDSLQREIDDLTREIEQEEQAEPAGEAVAESREGEKTGQRREPDPEQVRQQERKRIADITRLCREFGMDDQMEGFISGGTSVENVRAAVIEQMRRDGQPLNSRVVVETDEQDKFRDAASDALLMRGGVSLEQPAAGARDFMGMSLRDLAIESLAAEGNTNLNRLSSDELFRMIQRQFFNPSAVFPTIMDNAVKKAYVEGHKTAPVTFDIWTKRGTLKDFKTHDNNYLSGPAGELLEVPEGGELKHDVWKDEKRPTRKLKTYGRQFTMSRQAFINDDVGMITRMPAKYATSARKTQNKQCYEKLVGNPVIYDGKPLFGKDHKNLLAQGTGITREAVQGMIMALSDQKDEFDNVCIIRPAFLIVPSGYQFEMYTLFYSPTINTSDNTQAVNPLYQYRERIQVVEDPMINALCGGFGKQMPWWLLGAKEDTDFIEVDYLNGQEVPSIRRSEIPGTLGFVWDIYLDWNITVMDYRGVIKNPGVTMENPVKLA